MVPDHDAQSSDSLDTCKGEDLDESVALLETTVGRHEPDVHL